MKFETVLNAFEIAASRMIMSPLMSQTRHKRMQRQIMSFRAWLLMYSQHKCRARRLLWMLDRDEPLMIAVTPIGDYKITWERSNSNSRKASYITDGQSIHLASGLSFEEAKEICNKHFSNIVFSMIDCEEARNE